MDIWISVSYTHLDVYKRQLQADIIVTNRKNEKKAAKLEFTGNIVYIEDLLEAQVTDEDRKKLSDIKANALDIDPLYAIFTSGSTGVPKGVVVNHRSVIDFIECFTDIFGITDKDVIGNQAPFDLSLIHISYNYISLYITIYS